MPFHFQSLNSKYMTCKRRRNGHKKMGDGSGATEVKKKELEERRKEGEAKGWMKKQ
jgi:hypothetical protein